MATKRRRPAGPKQVTLSIYLREPRDKDRIVRAVELVGKRAGVQVKLSSWLFAVVMKAVEEEEQLAKR
jgi:hypothetical protein